MDSFGKLQRGRFDPYFPSKEIIARFREIAKDLGDPDAFRDARSDLMALQRDFRQLDIGESFNQGGRVGLAQGSGSPITETEINSLLARFTCDLSSPNLCDFPPASTVPKILLCSINQNIKHSNLN